MWLREVATRQTPERRELEAPSHEYNDQIVRHAVKMATGTEGKTAVMGMLVARQTLNAARTTRSRNLMHAERFVVLAPGVTIRSRLAELKPSNRHNVYDEMGLVPADSRQASMGGGSDDSQNMTCPLLVPVAVGLLQWVGGRMTPRTKYQIADPTITITLRWVGGQMTPRT